jgi:hypothetical protein
MSNVFLNTLRLSLFILPIITISSCQSELQATGEIPNEPAVTERPNATPLELLQTNEAPMPATASTPQLPLIVPSIQPLSTSTATSLSATPEPEINLNESVEGCVRLKPPFSISPDGQWVAGECNYKTFVVSQAANKTWVLSYDDIYGIEFDSGVGFIAPLHWSEDGQRLYLGISRGVSGPIHFANGWGILALDLNTGEITKVLEPLQHLYYSFAFSPDGNYLIYIVQQDTPLPMSILELSSGKIRSIYLDREYNQAGDIMWSPDLKQVVFCQAITEYEDEEEELFSLAMLDIETMAIRVLLPNDDQFRCPASWSEEDMIQLRDYAGHVWIYDLHTQSLQDG